MIIQLCSCSLDFFVLTLGVICEVREISIQGEGDPPNYRHQKHLNTGLFSQVLRYHSKTAPFYDETTFYHLKTGLVLYFKFRQIGVRLEVRPLCSILKTHNCLHPIPDSQPDSSLHKFGKSMNDNLTV